MNMLRMLRWVSASALVALAGCGGGGGDSTTTNTPSVNSGAGVVGASGGTVATGDGAATVVFPANAYTANTSVTIAASTTTPASTRLVPGTAFDFGPSGPFGQPARITVKYNPASLPLGALESRLVMYTVSGTTWTPVAGSTVNTTAHTVTAPVSHFSSYGILADNQFAGSYSGTYSGATFGTWQATVDADGKIVAAASGGFAGIGSVSFNGTSTIPLAGSGSSQGFTVTFGGTFTLQPNGTSVAASGTWNSSSGQAGNWTGSKIN